MTYDEMQEWSAFCQQATTAQLRNIIAKEREAGRKPEALLAEIVLKQRKETT
jgi:hypothetical protein